MSGPNWFAADPFGLGRFQPTNTAIRCESNLVLKVGVKCWYVIKSMVGTRGSSEKAVGLVGGRISCNGWMRLKVGKWSFNVFQSWKSCWLFSSGIWINGWGWLGRRCRWDRREERALESWSGWKWVLMSQGSLSRTNLKSSEVSL